MRSAARCAHQRLRHRQADRSSCSAAHCGSSAACGSWRASRARPRPGGRSAPRLLDQGRVVDLAAQPGAAGVAPDRAADHEALDDRVRGRAKPCASTSSGWFRPRITAPRQCGSRSATSAASASHDGWRHRRELPPLGLEAEVVEALDGAQHGLVVGCLPCGRRDDFEQQLVAAGARGLPQFEQALLLRHAQLGRRRRGGSAPGTSRPARAARSTSVAADRARAVEGSGREPGSSTGRPTHQPRPVAAHSASAP